MWSIALGVETTKSMNLFGREFRCRYREVFGKDVSAITKKDFLSVYKKIRPGEAAFE